MVSTRLIGVGVALGAAAVAASVLAGCTRRSKDDEGITPEQATDIVWRPHDRDGSGSVRLSGPITRDDERFFPNDYRRSDGTVLHLSSSFLEVLIGADTLGNRDSVATRDEVLGLMRRVDTDGTGLISRREEKTLTFAASYSEEGSWGTMRSQLLSEVPSQRLIAVKEPVVETYGPSHGAWVARLYGGDAGTRA